MSKTLLNMVAADLSGQLFREEKTGHLFLYDQTRADKYSFSVYLVNLNEKEENPRINVSRRALAKYVFVPIEEAKEADPNLKQRIIDCIDKERERLGRMRINDHDPFVDCFYRCALKVPEDL